MRSMRHPGLSKVIRRVMHEQQKWDELPFAVRLINWKSADEADLCSCDYCDAAFTRMFCVPHFATKCISPKRSVGGPKVGIPKPSFRSTRGAGKIDLDRNLRSGSIDFMGVNWFTVEKQVVNMSELFRLTDAQMARLEP
jgi:hypothetical protein